MKEKRNLFEKIFGNRETKKQLNTYKVLNGYDAFFSDWGKNVYDSKVARTAIDRIATHAAKLTPKHIKGDINHPKKGQINFMLQNRPNELMSRYDFIYKIVSQLYTYNNAFVFISKNEDGFITGFYPILSYEDKLLQDTTGNVYLRFKFLNGKEYTLPYNELIHLRRFFNMDDYWGSSNKVLNTDLDTAHTSSEGIKNAIKMTNSLKGILNFTNAMLKPEDIKKNRDNFVKDFLGKGNSSGIAALDTKATFQEMNIKPITLDKEQLKRVNQNIYDYFGISEEIIRNDYTPEKWNAFFEGVLEPLSLQMGEAFTNAIFNQKSIKEGHMIIFSTNRLQYASLNNKINLIKVAGAFGLLTKDDGREILDMAPLGGEEGKTILQSLNNIDSNIANNYQGGE